MLRLLIFIIRMAFTTGARFARARPTHRFGVGGRGRLELRKELAFPAVEFFAPGTVLQVIVRHANLTYEDDARLDIRSAALQLRSASGERLDLPMNTGEINTFQTLSVLLQFMASQPFGSLGYRWFDWIQPRIWSATVDGFRRGPSSFTQLRYHSQIILRWAAADGAERFARFRLVPANDETESGLPLPSDHGHPFRAARSEGDSREKDYLRKEWIARVTSGGGARYRFQVQLHQRSPSDPTELMDTSRTWDERSHPWLDAGELIVDSTLDAPTCESLRFNLGHQPRSMGVLPARSASDFNAPAYLRTVAYPSTQRARLGSDHAE